MKYRKFNKINVEVSPIGFGCMRFKTKMGKFDYADAEKQIMTAIENGEEIEWLW